MSQLVREGTGRNPVSLAPESLLFMYDFFSCSPVFQHEEEFQWAKAGLSCWSPTQGQTQPWKHSRCSASTFFLGGGRCGGSSLWCVAFSYCSTCPVACGILVPRPGIEATTPALEGGFLTTGPPAEFLQVLFDICKLTLKHGNSQPLHLQKESNTE